MTPLIIPLISTVLALAADGRRYESAVHADDVPESFWQVRDRFVVLERGLGDASLMIEDSRIDDAISLLTSCYDALEVLVETAPPFFGHPEVPEVGLSAQLRYLADVQGEMWRARDAGLTISRSDADTFRERVLLIASNLEGMFSREVERRNDDEAVERELGGPHPSSESRERERFEILSRLAFALFFRSFTKWRREIGLPRISKTPRTPVSAYLLAARVVHDVETRVPCDIVDLYQRTKRSSTVDVWVNQIVAELDDEKVPRDERMILPAHVTIPRGLDLRPHETGIVPSGSR